MFDCVYCGNSDCVTCYHYESTIQALRQKLVDGQDDELKQALGEIRKECLVGKYKPGVLGRIIKIIDRVIYPEENQDKSMDNGLKTEDGVESYHDFYDDRNYYDNDDNWDEFGDFD